MPHDGQQESLSSGCWEHLRKLSVEARFDRLSKRCVRSILLVSSLYDSFLFSESGEEEVLVADMYSELQLLMPPAVKRVSSADQAFSQLRKTHYDLVICLLRVEGMDVFNFLAEVKELNPSLPVHLLATSTKELGDLDPRVDETLRLNVHKTLSWEKGAKGMENVWAWPFVWQGDATLFLAMIQCTEDRFNAGNDVLTGDVRCIILVEDNVKFYSSYLPIMYTELVNQTHNVIADSRNRTQRIRRMRARPKILLATTYEEGLELYSKFKNNLLAVITDVGYPRNGIHDPHAGIELARVIRSERSEHELPMLVQSTDETNETVAQQLRCYFLSKNQSTLMKGFRDFLRGQLGFGPFTFRSDHVDPLSVEGEASDLQSFLDLFGKVSHKSIRYHMSHHHISQWVMARSEFRLARALINTVGCGSRYTTMPDAQVETMRRSVIELIQEHIDCLQNGIVSDFSNTSYTSRSRFCKIGDGSLGGKGRGLAFMNSVLEGFDLATGFPSVKMFIPRTLVLTSDIFERFMEENNLLELVLRDDIKDEEISDAFMKASIPTDLLQKLCIFLQHTTSPLAVRSSSLFEDSIHEPFAGVYDTFMIANNNTEIRVRPGEQFGRLNELSTAIKLVYASTYFNEAKAYALATANRSEEDKMAVLIQDLIGRNHDERFFYPDFSGVAQSYNFYPKNDEDPRDGVICVAAGLGFTIVNGGQCVRFSPKQGTSDVTGEGFQRSFMCLDLSHPGPRSGAHHDVHRNVKSQAYPKHRNLSLYSMFPADPATLSSRNGDLHDVAAPFCDVHGTPFMSLPVDMNDADHTESTEMVSMSEILSNSDLPLRELIDLLLSVGASAFARPVELEFAVLLRQDKLQCKHHFALLQMRPMAQLSSFGTASAMSLTPADLEAVIRSDRSNNILCSTQLALSHGHLRNISDLLYVSSEAFHSAPTTECICNEIEEINKQLVTGGRKYMLVGPGRWGTTMQGLGVPVMWSQISGAACIVETNFDSFHVAPSQGSHFFQNIVSFGIGYFTVNSSGENGGFFDHTWTSLQPSSSSTQFVRHLRFTSPLDIVIDGRTRCGIVMKPNTSFKGQRVIYGSNDCNGFTYS